MSDVDDFFAERDRRMNIPEEDVDEYIQTRLAATRRNRSLEERVDVVDAPHYQVDSQRRFTRSLGFNIVGGYHRGETVDLEDEQNPAFVGLLPGPSSATHATACYTKRRKTMKGHSILKPIACASVCDGPNPDLVASRTAIRGCGASAERFSEHNSAKHVGTVSQQIPLGMDGRNSMSSSTDLSPGCDRGPTMPRILGQVVQAVDQAVPVTEQDSGYSTHEDASRPEMKAVHMPRRQKYSDPFNSAPDNPSVMEVFSLSPVPSCHNAAVFSSTTLDGHRRNRSPLPENPPILPSTDGIPRIASTIVPAVITSPSSRINDDSHEVGCIGETPISRTPAGFNAAHLDVSNVSSPADTLAGQFLHVCGGSPVPLTEAPPSSSNTRVPREPKARKTVRSSKRSREAPGYGSSSKRVKDKPKLITPLEYAQKLQSCLNLHVKTSYLKGKRIFYVGGDMMYAGTTTRGRMEYIVKHGGTLVPKYDPTIVTHIVTDAGIAHTLQALSLKSLSDIPDSIPTVTWDWVISGYGRANKRKPKVLLGKGDKERGGVGGDCGDENNLFDFEFMHAAFSERMDAGCSSKNTRWGKQGRKASGDLASGTGGAHNDNADISHISTFSQDSKPSQTKGRAVSLTVLPPPPLDLRAVDGGETEEPAVPEGVGKVPQNDDPLAEYYGQARADREARWNQDSSGSDDEDNNFDHHRRPTRRRGFACDLKEYQPTVCANQRIVDKLEELRELHKAKTSEDDRWRAYSYGKCIPALRSYPKPIKSFSEARSIRGVGEKTALKIMEIINTGDLRRIKYENTEDVAATRIFQGVYGVGRRTAFAWFANGLRTLDDVRARKGGIKLSTAQEIGLRFYDDINSRMPREEARRLFEMIKPIALAIDSRLFVEVMGSYRRGKVDCGDIDILITRPTTDGRTHQGVLRVLLDRLHAAGIITEDLAVPDDFSDLELVYRGLCKLPESGARRRRIDFLCVPWESRGAALLYYTGDDIFNRAMRLKANKHGYSLNQRGLYAGVLRDPHDRHKKVCEGHIVASETEQDIFSILCVPWQEPHERVRG